MDDFNCLRCGKCCKLKVRLSLEDIAMIKSKGHDNFYIVENGNFYFKRIYGYCVFLKFDNGFFACSIHDYKPDGCKEFPFKIVDKKKFFDPRCKVFNLPVLNSKNFRFDSVEEDKKT
jgi:Fe-S-cluster containining protein